MQSLPDTPQVLLARFAFMAESIASESTVLDLTDYLDIVLWTTAILPFT